MLRSFALTNRVEQDVKNTNEIVKTMKAKEENLKLIKLKIDLLEEKLSGATIKLETQADIIDTLKTKIVKL